MKIATATATAAQVAVAAAAGKITGSFSFGNGAQWLADRRMLAVNLRPTKRVEETLQQRYYLQTTRQAGVVIAPAWLLTNDRASIITEPLTSMCLDQCIAERRQSNNSEILACQMQDGHRATVAIDCSITVSFLYRSSFSGHCLLGK